MKEVNDVLLENGGSQLEQKVNPGAFFFEVLNQIRSSWRPKIGIGLKETRLFVKLAKPYKF